MSHFSVLVCVPGEIGQADLDDYLAEVMERWNENRDVPAYRDYEEGAPEDFWWVRAIRAGAEHHRNGTGVLPHHPGDPYGFKRTELTSQQREEQQRARFAEDAAWAQRLGEHPTWDTVVRCYNEDYHPGNELALVGDHSDSGRMHHDPQTGRAYTWRTANPESMWDYWGIGGRWHNYFIAVEDSPALIRAAPDGCSPTGDDSVGLRCDGGPVRLLDLAEMRRRAEVAARTRFDRWERVCDATPPARSWSELAGLVELKEVTAEQARRQYLAQPRIVAALQAKIAHEWGDCPIEEFMGDREEYVLEARRAAVPGYALVTLDRAWVAPGRMGWFGVSSEQRSERSVYHVAVNTYLDQLDPNTWLVALDCHI